MKPKLSIVVPIDVNPRVLSVFEPLVAEFDVSAFALSNPSMDNFKDLPFKPFFFDPIPDMPGYLRNLDEHISSSDLILGVGTANLSSFQALRIALKFRRPFVCLSNDYTPNAYKEYANVRAIQTDIYQRASMILSLCERTTSCLIADGVNFDMVREVTPRISLDRFRSDIERRNKFRKHAKIPHECRVFIVNGPLESTPRIDEVFRAVALAVRQKPKVLENLRVVVIGDGSSARELKYLASDLEIGKNILFLHQDPEPFVQDLYAAADACIQIKPTNDGFNLCDPFKIWEACSTGAIPVLGGGTPAESYLRPFARTLADESSLGISRAILDICEMSNESLKEEQENVRNHCLQVFDKFSHSQIICIEFKSCLMTHRNATPSNVDVRKSIVVLVEKAKRGKVADSLVDIEDLLLRAHPDSTIYAEILAAKGDILSKNHRYDEAITAFNDVLKINRESRDALCGLGYTAFKLHAFEESLAFFRRALASHPGDAESMVGVGIVYKKLRLTEEALQWLTRAIERDSSNTLAITATAQTCLDAPNSSRVTQTLERVIEIAGDQKPLLMALGQLYMNQGRSAEGSEIIKRALAADDENKKAAA